MGIKFNKLKEAYGTDLNDSENGKWFEIAVGKLKIRRFTSKHTQAIRAQFEEPYRRGSNKFAELPEKVQDEINEKVLAHSTVVDWEGEDFVDDNGEKIPYSPEDMLLAIKELPDLKLEISSIALNMDNFKTKEKEEVLKN